MTQPLASLKPGTRFGIPSLDRTGTLVRLGPGAAIVKYDGSKTVLIGDRSFVVTSEPVSVSLQTHVVVLPRPLKGDA